MNDTPSPSAFGTLVNAEAEKLRQAANASASEIGEAVIRHFESNPTDYDLDGLFADTVHRNNKTVERIVKGARVWTYMQLCLGMALPDQIGEAARQDLMMAAINYAEREIRTALVRGD